MTCMNPDGDGSGTVGNVFKCSESNKGIQFLGDVSGVSFTSTSDQKIKDNVENVSVSEAAAILDQVKVKKYTRNDRKNEPRVGFIAQHLEAATRDSHFAHIVGSTLVAREDNEGNDIGEEEELLTVDYARLVTVLWSTVQDLRGRVKKLEEKLG